MTPQLPLFASHQPVCQIVLFPVRSRVGFIRKAARHLAEAKTERDAAFRWRRSIAGMRRHLELAGLTEAAIADELRAFGRMVDGECRRIGSRWVLLPQASGNTGGAA